MFWFLSDYYSYTVFGRTETLYLIFFHKSLYSGKVADKAKYKAK